MGELRNGTHEASGCSDNLGGVGLTIVDDDLAEAADVEHVIVVLKHVAAKVGLHREAVAADALAVQLVAFFRQSQGRQTSRLQTPRSREPTPRTCPV